MSSTQFLRIFWARRWLIALAVISSLVAAILIGKLLPPRYKANLRSDDGAGQARSGDRAR